MRSLLRAVITGLAIGLVPANVWPLLLRAVRMPLAAILEVLLLAAYAAWAAGAGPPKALRATRLDSFRVRPLTATKWGWGLLAAVTFAVSVHAAMVVLFRMVSFPSAAFHAGYDFSFIAPTWQWLAVVVSAASAGICEETGFRGYMQRPLEKRHGPAVAILVSSSFFMLVHLSKGWALIGMVPIVFGAGLLLGLLAFAAETLVFCMIGHTIMDVGLFAYWWTQMAGRFSQRPISETGPDRIFLIECATFGVALLITLRSIGRLRGLGASPA